MRRVDAKLDRRLLCSGLTSGEGLITRVADPEEVGFDMDKSDGETTRKYADNKRLYVIEEEYSRVLTCKDREGNVLSANLRLAFDLGDLEKVTVRPLAAKNAHVCMVGHITPQELHHCLSFLDTLNGFANRYAWFLVRSDKQIKKLDVTTPDEVYEPFATHLRRLADFGKRCEESGSYKEALLRCDPEAAQLWESELYDRLDKLDRGQVTESTLGRGKTIVLRMAVIYAALDYEVKREELGIEVITFSPIRRVHLEAAMAVWEYCEASARILFQRGRPQSPVGIEGKIVQVLRDHGPRLTKDVINDHLSPKQKEQFPDGIARLLEKGIVTQPEIRSGKPGRPPVAYELV